MDMVSTRKDVKFIEVSPETIKEQGPYHVFLLRVTNQLGNEEDPKNMAIVQLFQDYFSKNPLLKVYDPIEHQKIVVRRDLMALVLEKLNHNPELNVSCPKSVVIDLNGDFISNIPKDFTFPAVCKSLKASGSPIAHIMGIFPTPSSLASLRKTSKESIWLLQEYINHNATLFKVYTLKNMSHVVARVSLPNNLGKLDQPIMFDSQEWKDTLPDYLMMPEAGKAPPPPMRDIHKISAALVEALGLSLFGYDIVVSVETGHYAVIDINYLPDYRGVEAFHERLLELLLS